MKLSMALKVLCHCWIKRLLCFQLAEAAGFKPTVHKWDNAERLDLMAELDAAYFLLYGIERNDVEYILTTFAGLRDETPDLLSSSTTSTKILKFYDDFKSESRS